jgi:chromosome segregation ATPase
MPFDMEFDDDLAQRRLQRLEQRLSRAQDALAGARTLYASLRQSPQTNQAQLDQALRQVERAQRQLADIQFDMELAAARAAAPRLPDNDQWRDLGR